MDKLSRTDKCVTIGRCKISRLLFVNDLVCWLPRNLASQRKLNGLAVACDIAGIKISTFKIQILRLSRNPVQYSLQVGGEVKISRGRIQE